MIVSNVIQCSTCLACGPLHTSTNACRRKKNSAKVGKTYRHNKGVNNFSEVVHRSAKQLAADGGLGWQGDPRQDLVAGSATTPVDQATLFVAARANVSVQWHCVSEYDVGTCLRIGLVHITSTTLGRTNRLMVENGRGPRGDISIAPPPIRSHCVSTSRCTYRVG